jgi:hypothetical protein
MLSITIAALKAEARAFSNACKAAGTPMLYSHALDAIARKYGCRDYRTARAAILGIKTQPAAPTLLQIIASYRVKNYSIALPEVLDRLAKDHPQVTFDRAEVEAIMRQSPTETIIAAKALTVTLLPPGSSEELERYVRNRGFNPEELDNMDFSGTPESRHREALERKLSEIEDAVSDTADIGDAALHAQLMERHEEVARLVAGAEFAEEFDDEGEVTG